MPGGSATHYAKAILGLNAKQFKSGTASARRSWMGFRTDLIRSIGPMVGALGAAGLGRAIIKTGATFEQQMQNIKAVTRSSTAEMATMESAARKLGAQTSFSATEVAEGMTILAKATGSATKSVQGIEAVLKLAGSEGGDMATTAELIIGSMNAMGLSFDQSNRVANVFAAAAQNTRMSIERLADSMRYGAPIGREFGMSLEETTSAMSLLVDSGLEASQAGTGLRSALTDLVKTGNKEVIKALDGMSIKGDGLAAVLRALSDAGIRGEKAFKLLNVRGANAIAILQRQAERMVDLRKKITGTNAAWEAYETQQDSTLMAWERVKSALSEVSISIFQTFGTDLKGALDTAAEKILDARNLISTFAADTIRYLKMAAFEVTQYGSRFGELLEGLKAGLETVDVGEALAEALLPSISPKIKYALAIVTKDFAAAQNAWTEMFGDSGGGAVDAFSEAFMASFGKTQEEISAAREEYYAKLEADHEKHLERIASMDVASKFKAPEMEIDTSYLQTYLEEHWRNVTTQAQQAGEKSREEFQKGLEKISTEKAKARVRELATEARKQHRMASYTVVSLWNVAFDHITDLHITGGERWKGIIGGAMNVISSMLRRMIAEAIAAKLQIETIFSGMGLGGMLGLGVGFGFLANRFHGGGMADGPPGGEQLAILQNREFVMPPGPSQRFRPMLEEMRRGRLPQLAAAGGGGMHVEAHVHVPSGAILYAHNEMGIRELAETFNRAIEKTVRKAYRE